MTPDERAETEATADRSLRRGELAQALAGYRSILTAFPDDEVIVRKLSELQNAFDPAELRHPKAVFADAGPAGNPQTPEQEGERLLSQGDYAGALAAYRRALAARPDNELVKERLGELFRLVQAGASGQAPAAPQSLGPGGLAAARQPQSISPAQQPAGGGAPVPPVAARTTSTAPTPRASTAAPPPTTAAGARANPTPPAAPSVPRDAGALYQALLTRIASRRRP